MLYCTMQNSINFFTATILRWQHVLKQDKYKQMIIDKMQYLVDANRVWIYGFVIMPNHIHQLWRAKEGHHEKEVQRDLLRYTAQHIKNDLVLNHPMVLPHFRSTQNDRHYHFWERRARSKEIENRKMLEQKLDYIHNNPVLDKWKLSNLPEDFYFSSASYYLSNQTPWSFITHYTQHI